MLPLNCSIKKQYHKFFNEATWHWHEPTCQYHTVLPSPGSFDLWPWPQWPLTFTPIIFSLFGPVQTTDYRLQTTDRKRCIWAHRASCTGGLKKVCETYAKRRISGFLELLLHFKVLLKGSTKKSVKENVRSTDFFFWRKFDFGNSNVFSLCPFFFENCPKTNQAIYEKQRINLERP